MKINITHTHTHVHKCDEERIFSLLNKLVIMANEALQLAQENNALIKKVLHEQITRNEELQQEIEAGKVDDAAILASLQESNAALKAADELIPDAPEPTPEPQPEPTPEPGETSGL